MASLPVLIAQILGLIPSMVQAGLDIADLWNSTKAVIEENRVPGDAEWDKLDALVAQHKALFDQNTADVT